MHTLMLADALVSGGYRVTVCAYYEHDPVMVKQIEDIGANVCLLRLSRDGGGRNPGRMPRLVGRLTSLFCGLRQLGSRVNIPLVIGLEAI